MNNIEETIEIDNTRYKFHSKSIQENNESILLILMDYYKYYGTQHLRKKIEGNLDDGRKILLFNCKIQPSLAPWNIRIFFDYLIIYKSGSYNSITVELEEKYFINKPNDFKKLFPNIETNLITIKKNI